MSKKPGSQAKLKKNVLDKELCTGCGACVGLCPYQTIYADRTVQLFPCDLMEGKCFDFCPRLPSDWAAIREKFYNPKDWTTELGAVSAYFLTRAADADLRARAQHGGTVTALLELAMTKGWITSAIVADWSNRQEQAGIVVEEPGLLRNYAKSRFIVSPAVETFNRLPDKSKKKIGIVATPCQAQALAKIKTSRLADEQTKDSLALTIGLFCGWSLSWDKFSNLLAEYGLNFGLLTGMDIPSGKNVLELISADGVVLAPLAKVLSAVRTACRYCMDSTAEFADISVGAARFGGAGEEMQGWNQVLVRSANGKRLLDLARTKGVLEFREAPAQSWLDLKNAAAEKKKKALKNIVEKSRSVKNLFYLKCDDPAARKYLPADKKGKGMA